MKRLLAPLAALCALACFAFVSAAPANAACSNSGNTSGTDSAALVATLYEMCNTGAALPTGAATAANQTSANTKLDQLHTDLTAGGAAQTYTSDTGQHVAAGTATTVIKSGAGTLVRISINTKGASSNTLTCYDNTAGSGTVIAIIDGTSDRDHNYGFAFATGLTCVSATGTGADYTAVYR